MIITGDCRTEMRNLIEQGVKVQMCVTSPPYWGLRSYLPDKVQLKKNLSQEEMESLKKELTLFGLNGTIKI